MTVASANIPARPHPPRRNPARHAGHGLLIFVCIGFLIPFLWMVSTSLKTIDKVMSDHPTFIPHPFAWENYKAVLTHPSMHFLLFARNTLIVAILSVAGNLVSSALAAYAFARIRFRGRGILFALMLSTMMIPFPVVMVPLFTIFHWLGSHHMGQWLGTYKPLWVPYWFGTAFSIFLLRQFFITVPDELSEAARIDGCTELGIFLRIILPMAKPALAVVSLFTFMYVWNDFLGPLVYLQDEDQYTLTLGLQSFQSAHGGTDFHYLMAASVLVIAPVVVLFFLTQKTFIQGIATTGMKG
ncbi:MAG TPA: carbohydrate ABC transporter permease [Tepidisphaeraceae bacterium]|nr:carbohydrate ABC transporter permease [Tepidisphaeraceae bacterium]